MSTEGITTAFHFSGFGAIGSRRSARRTAPMPRLSCCAVADESRCCALTGAATVSVNPNTTATTQVPRIPEGFYITILRLKSYPRRRTSLQSLVDKVQARADADVKKH